jgi:hypothetical protein
MRRRYVYDVTIEDGQARPWLLDYEAACVLMVRGFGVDEVVDRWLDRPLTPLVSEHDRAEWETYEYDTGESRGLIAVGELQCGVTLVWESPGGFESSRNSVLARMSVNGSACSNYWNDVNCTPMFGYAVQGRVVRRLTTDDPTFSYGHGVNVPLPEEAEFPWPQPWTGDDVDTPDVVDGRQSALSLQARLMDAGFPVSSWLDRNDIRWFGTPFPRDAEPRQDERLTPS